MDERTDTLATPNETYGLLGITKSFGGTRALKGVDLTIRPGRVHALVGENGAGKSTALAVLAGRILPTTGLVQTPNGVFQGLTPKRARGIGIHAVYQELTIVPALSPQANVFLGSELRTAGFLRNGEMRQQYVDLCERVGVRASYASRAGSLSVAEQQMLEILRAVRSDARVILFDEPTAALAASERTAFFKVVEQLKAAGVAIAFVSHNLDEVLAHSDDITVFRDGEVVERASASESTKTTLVSAMLGATLADRPDKALKRSPVPHDILMSVTGLTTSKSASPQHFDLLRGEILGIAGLVGSGRTSLLRALAGLDGAAQGTVAVAGRQWALPWSVRKAQQVGISLLPEDRKLQGLSMLLSATGNISMGQSDKAARLGFVNATTLREMCSNAVGGLGFDTQRLGDPAWTFSGGNQQKLLLGRWIIASQPILLADEPSRGVDVGVREQIENALREFTQQGRSVILVSSELEEVSALSDRILVMKAGEIVATLISGQDDTSVESLLRLAFGATSREGTRD